MAAFSKPIIENVRGIAAEVDVTVPGFTRLALKFDENGTEMFVEIRGSGHPAYAARLVEAINRAAEDDANG